MPFSIRHATSSRPARTDIEVEERRQEMLDDFLKMTDGLDIHPCMIANMDESPLRLGDLPQTTYEEKGKTDVKTLHSKSRDCTTLALAVTAAGEILKPCLFWRGKTDKSLPDQPWPVMNLVTGRD